MIAGGGAMTVGLGAKQSINDTRLLPMLFVSLGMAFAAFLGVIMGHTNFLLALLGGMIANIGRLLVISRNMNLWKKAAAKVHQEV